jgi:SAM-dependent methyltransferase
MSADSNLSTISENLHKREKFGFVWAFRRHLRESIRHYGLGRTSWELLLAVSNWLRELLPDRRRARYGDLDFDLERSVNTTRSTVSFREQFMAALTGRPYFASEPWLFEEIMQALPIQFSDFTFVDLGSGKGRTLLMASDYPFRRIIGVEFMPEWHRVAAQNIRAYCSGKQQCRQIESLCMDARDFPFPHEPLVIYLFNPFPEPVFAGVLENLRKSWEQKVRAVYVAYRYLEHEKLLAKSGWLRKIAGTEQWAVYRSV